MKKTIITAAGFVFLIIACTKSSTNTTATVDCSGAAKSFVADVSPVIQTSCAVNAGCHAAGSTHDPGELITYSEVFNARSNIRSSVASGIMPQGSSLSAVQRNVILCWIDNGAANN